MKKVRSGVLVSILSASLILTTGIPAMADTGESDNPGSTEETAAAGVDEQTQEESGSESEGATVSGADAEKADAAVTANEPETDQTSGDNGQTDAAKNTEKADTETTAAAQTATNQTEDSGSSAAAGNSGSGADTEASSSVANTAGSGTDETAVQETSSGSFAPAAVDNSTSIADGEYEADNFTFSGGSKKAKFFCDKIIIRGGKSYAVIRTKSKSYTHFYLGTAKSDGEITELYNPDSNTKGSGVYATAKTDNGASAEIPVALNQDMALSGRTTAMGNTHWITYSIHVTLNEESAGSEDGTGDDQESGTDDGQSSGTDNGQSSGMDNGQSSGTDDGQSSGTDDQDGETGDGGQTVKIGALTVTSTNKMFNIELAELKEDGLHITLSGHGYTQLFRGSQKDAAKSAENDPRRIHYSDADNDGQYEFVIPVTAEDGTFEVSALSSRKNSWFSRTITLDQENMTIQSTNADYTDPAYEPVPDGTGRDASEDGSSSGDQSGTGSESSSSGNQSGSTGSTGTAGNQSGSGSGNSGSGSGASGSGNASVQINTGSALTGGTSGGNRVGSYTFSYYGGSGRSKITCSGITMRGNQAYATITFSKTGGGSSSYDAVRVGGQTFIGSNTFTIPVNLNGNTAVSARTTAMSHPYWIDFTLYVGFKEGDGSGTVINEGSSSGNSMIRSVSTKTLDETAPEIEGLTSKQEETITNNSDLLRIFAYDNDIYLIEVNMVKRTAREDNAVSDGDTDAAEADADTAEEEASDTFDSENTDELSESRQIAQLYQNDVVKYLVVPEDQEIPAGLEKEAIIIRQPQESTYAASAEALTMMDEIGAAGDVTSVGLSEDEITSETVLSGLAEQDGEEGKVVSAGDYNDWDLREMILLKNTLAIEPSDILPKDEASEDEDMETFTDLTKRAVQMDMAVFVDRSQDEQNELAKAEWYYAYGIIFNQKDNGWKMYQQAVKGN